MMVEPAPFDIYLCDNCDAELYSKEAILVCYFSIMIIIKKKNSPKTNVKVFFISDRKKFEK